MATVLELELEAFHQFLDRNGRESGTLEHAVEQFRTYQRELSDARARIREAKESSARGESKELNIEETIHSVRTRLAEEGITD